jgi:transposase
MSPHESPRVPASMTPDEKVAFAARFPVHVGVDTGKSFHKLVARGPDGRRTKAVRVDVSRASFEAADRFLVETFGVPRGQVLIGLEFAGHHGFTFTEYLRQQGYAVVAVLPSVTKKLKEVEDNSPRKDDAKDAAQVCKLLGAGLFVGTSLLSEQVAEMRVLATERHRLSVEATRLKNRLHGALDLCWPEFAAQFYDLAKPTPLAVLRRWPLPQDVLTQPRAVKALVKAASRNHVAGERVERLLETARETVGLRSAADGRRAEIARLLARLDLVREHALAVEARLAELVDSHRGARALATVPEVSAVCAATLVAELGTPETYVAPRQVLKLAGMNLARKESGTSVKGRVRQTKRGRPLLRRQLFLLAGRWCQQRGLYRDEYVGLLARNGGSRTSAMCAVARKLVPMLLHVMQSGEAFDATKWRAARGPQQAGRRPTREGAAA